MSWILFIVVMNHGGQLSITNADFPTQAACVFAAKEAQLALSNLNVQAFCINRNLE